MMHSSVRSEKDSAPLYSFTLPPLLIRLLHLRSIANSVLDTKFQVRKQSYGALNYFSSRETLHSSMKNVCEQFQRRLSTSRQPASPSLGRSQADKGSKETRYGEQGKYLTNPETNGTRGPRNATSTVETRLTNMSNIYMQEPATKDKVISISYFHTRISYKITDLQKKHTIFGKVTGEAIYYMLKLEEALVGENDRSHYSPRLIKTIILNNPFSDIIPRIILQKSEEVKDSSIAKTTAVKDFNILSFGGEVKEDEEESVILNKKFTGKGKSAYDHLTDPKLSSQPAVEPPGPPNKKRKKVCNSDWESDDEVKT
ncbi:Peptidyl-prolyl cis-trans isomerase CWC27 like protein [Eufriesea mexicana]|uniref:Peptidyl-prolyl cis-trans isomerase CWC27 like protein n=1 Tax=Eufriesea mexicana TaxID=516756 RepID=A0A310SD33_9HYME|nr:Peptidyl-prolyl cis-trans isomerase CWC27 like protein [Eufriesea mexicana]